MQSINDVATNKELQSTGAQYIPSVGSEDTSATLLRNVTAATEGITAISRIFKRASEKNKNEDLLGTSNAVDRAFDLANSLKDPNHPENVSRKLKEDIAKATSGLDPNNPEQVKLKQDAERRANDYIKGLNDESLGLKAAVAKQKALNFINPLLQKRGATHGDKTPINSFIGSIDGTIPSRTTSNESNPLKEYRNLVQSDPRLAAEYAITMEQIKGRATQADLDNAINDRLVSAKNFVTDHNRDFNTFIGALRTPQFDDALKVLNQYMGESGADEFVMNNTKVALNAGTYNPNVSFDEIRKIAGEMGYSESDIRNLATQRDNLLEHPNTLTTSSLPLLDKYHPDAGAIGRQVMANSIDEGKRQNLDLGVSRTIKSIQADPNLSNEQKRYRINLAKDFAAVKQQEYQKDPINAAINDGILTGDGHITDNPKNPYDERAAAAKGINDMGYGYGFFKPDERVLIMQNDPSIYPYVKGVKTSIDHMPTKNGVSNPDPNMQIAYVDQLKQAGSDFGDIINTDIPQRDITKYKQKVSSGEIGQHRLLSREQFDQRMLHPISSDIDAIMNEDEKSNIIVPAFRDTTNLNKLAAKSASEKMSAYVQRPVNVSPSVFTTYSDLRDFDKVMKRNPNLLNEMYTIYKIRESQADAHNPRTTPTMRELFNYAGYETYILPHSDISLYHKKGSDPEKAIMDSIDFVINNFNDTELGNAIGFGSNYSKHFNKDLKSSRNRLGHFTIMENYFLDWFDVRNITSDTIGVFIKDTPQPLVDPKTGKQVVVSIPRKVLGGIR